MDQQYERLSSFMDRFMTLPSHDISYSEGFHIMNQSCSEMNKENCEKLTLEIIPNIISQKYSHLISYNKLQLLWEMMYYINRVSGISYDTFSSYCASSIIKKMFRNPRHSFSSSVLRRQALGHHSF